MDKLKSDFSFLAICTQCRKRLDEINESIEGQSAAEAAVPIMNNLEATELDEVRTRLIYPSFSSGKILRKRKYRK